MHFVRIIYIFPALAKCLCCLLFPLGKQMCLIMRLKIKYYKIWPKIALRVINWDWGTLYSIYIYFRVLSANVFICYYCLVIFSILDKNLWFSSQRRREGVVGDANDN